MRFLTSTRDTENHVVAHYADSALTFALPRGATLEELAECLDILGKSHGAAPIKVDVKIGS